MKLATLAIGRPVRSGERIGTIDLPPLSGMQGAALQLVLADVRKTAAAVVLRISLAGGHGSPVVAGDLYTYGESPDAPGLEAAERFQPMTLSLDVTAAVRKLGGAPLAGVSIEVLDHQGRPVKEPLVLQGIELHSENPD